MVQAWALDIPLSSSCCRYLDFDLCNASATCAPSLCTLDVEPWTNVTDQCDCATYMGGDSIIPYLEWQSCSFGCSRASAAVAYIIAAMWLIFLFSLVASTADEYMVPNLERLSASLRLSPNVAGVTLLALGNGAPDFFVSLAAFQSTTSSSIGIGSLLGGGIFITSFVLGAVATTKPFTSNRRPLLRDVVCYMLATVLLAYVCLRGYVTQLEAGLLVALYIIYVLVVICGRVGYQKYGKRHRTSSTHPNPAALDQLHRSGIVQSVMRMRDSASLAAGIGAQAQPPVPSVEPFLSNGWAWKNGIANPNPHTERFLDSSESETSSVSHPASNPASHAMHARLGAGPAAMVPAAMVPAAIVNSTRRPTGSVTPQTGSTSGGLAGGGASGGGSWDLNGARTSGDSCTYSFMADYDDSATPAPPTPTALPLFAAQADPASGRMSLRPASAAASCSCASASAVGGAAVLHTRDVEFSSATLEALEQIRAAEASAGVDITHWPVYLDSSLRRTSLGNSIINVGLYINALPR